MPQARLGLLFGLLAYMLLMRLLPYALINCDFKIDPGVLYYPWNFSPLTAICLFGAASLSDRRLSFFLPLATLLLSNLGIAGLSGHFEWGFPPRSWGFTYFHFALAVGLGTLLRGQKSRGLASRALLTGLGFEIYFFAASNFLVWLNGAWSATPLYEPTGAGLFECYIAALAFFGRSLLSTGVFSLLLFSPLGIRVVTENNVKLDSGHLASLRVE